jgi:hypothetical protein
MSGSASEIIRRVGPNCRATVTRRLDGLRRADFRVVVRRAAIRQARPM